MSRSTLLAALSLSLGLITASAIFSHAGPLDPPAGPITPSFKTLTEVEPRIAISFANTPGDSDSLFKITSRGSYYLTGNINAATSKHGIEIAANGVTLDLNGYFLLGDSKSLDAIIATVAAPTNITIRNGTIQNWEGDGIDLTNGSFNCSVSDVRVSNSKQSGIVMGQNCTATNCISYLNELNGITVQIGSTVNNCAASENSNVGISAGSGSVITACAAASNGSKGISTATGVIINGCSVEGNSVDGINTANGCSIINCNTRFNGRDGIVSAGDSLLTGNNCTSNGFTGDGAGIHITGSNNRLEGNVSIGADRGIDVDAVGNFIARNICTNNTTNWSIVSGNVVLVVIATNAGTINGNGGGISPGSTDPNANFTY